VLKVRVTHSPWQAAETVLLLVSVFPCPGGVQPPMFKTMSLSYERDLDPTTENSDDNVAATFSAYCFFDLLPSERKALFSAVVEMVRQMGCVCEHLQLDSWLPCADGLAGSGRVVLRSKTPYDFPVLPPELSDLISQALVPPSGVYLASLVASGSFVDLVGKKRMFVGSLALTLTGQQNQLVYEFESDHSYLHGVRVGEASKPGMSLPESTATSSQSSSSLRAPQQQAPQKQSPVDDDVSDAYVDPLCSREALTDSLVDNLQRAQDMVDNATLYDFAELREARRNVRWYSALLAKRDSKKLERINAEQRRQQNAANTPPIVLPDPEPIRVVTYQEPQLDASEAPVCLVGTPDVATGPGRELVRLRVPDGSGSHYNVVESIANSIAKQLIPTIEYSLWQKTTYAVRTAIALQVASSTLEYYSHSVKSGGLNYSAYSDLGPNYLDIYAVCGQKLAMDHLARSLEAHCPADSDAIVALGNPGVSPTQQRDAAFWLAQQPFSAAVPNPYAGWTERLGVVAKSVAANLALGTAKRVCSLLPKAFGSELDVAPAILPAMEKFLVRWIHGPPRHPHQEHLPNNFDHMQRAAFDGTPLNLNGRPFPQSPPALSCHVGGRHSSSILQSSTQSPTASFCSGSLSPCDAALLGPALLGQFSQLQTTPPTGPSMIWQPALLSAPLSIQNAVLSPGGGSTLSKCSAGSGLTSSSMAITPHPFRSKNGSRVSPAEIVRSSCVWPGNEFKTIASDSPSTPKLTSCPSVRRKQRGCSAPKRRSSSHELSSAAQTSQKPCLDRVSSGSLSTSIQFGPHRRICSLNAAVAPMKSVLGSPDSSDVLEPPTI